MWIGILCHRHRYVKLLVDRPPRYRSISSKHRRPPRWWLITRHLLLSRILKPCSTIFSTGCATELIQRHLQEKTRTLIGRLWDRSVSGRRCICWFQRKSKLLSNLLRNAGLTLSARSVAVLHSILGSIREWRTDPTVTCGTLLSVLLLASYRWTEFQSAIGFGSFGELRVHERISNETAIHSQFTWYCISMVFLWNFRWWCRFLTLTVKVACFAPCCSFICPWMGASSE